VENTLESVLDGGERLHFPCARGKWIATRDQAPMAREVHIEPQADRKGRTFAATLLGTIEADSLWERGTSDAIRPVWAVFTGTEDALRPFAANLRLGRKATFPSNSRKAETLELLKTAGYQYVWQREPEGSILTVFLPDLFRLDPGMVDPDGAKFVILPDAAWLRDQKIDTESRLYSYALSLMGQDSHAKFDVSMMPVLIPLAFLFSAYLDRRTRVPLLSDGRFYVQLLLACLRDGLASFSSDRGSFRWGRREAGFGCNFSFVELGTCGLGMVPGIAFSATHEQIDSLLAAEVAVFFKRTSTADAANREAN
jgi:hypothetical protein